MKHRISGKETEEVCDGVMLCNGHLGKMNFPNIPGMKEFKVGVCMCGVK